RIYISILIITLIGLLGVVPHLQAQTQEQETHHGEYSESALRRFEIITLSSLPFTAVHSYLGVRGIKMIQTNKISPILTPDNYRVMGISAVTLSLFIGIWDWLHTRKVDRSAPSIPGKKPFSPPTEEEEPPDGTLAGIPNLGPHVNIHAISTHVLHPHESMSNSQLNMWTNDPSIGLVIPFIELRF
ncbi:hypothetical protein JT359_17065, partial [Candidatus Poribacteria bacterium]|nr:hypothetical protein [Candidatus Poribacteria bacterium]